MARIDLYSSDNKKQNIKCKAFKPFVSEDGQELSHIPQNDILFNAEDLGFSKNASKIGNRRIEIVEGKIRTTYLKPYEVDVDWQVEYDGFIYIVTSVGVLTKNRQKGLSKRPTTVTTLFLRRG